MLASGIRVSMPSDDPVATQRILRWRTIDDNITQYQRNIDSTKLWMNSSESVLSSIQEIMERVYEIASTGANDLVPDDIRANYAVEIEALLKEVITLANTSVNDNYLFAGHLTDTKPFTYTLAGGLINSVDYNGDGGQREVEASEGNTYTINIIGSNDADNDGASDYSFPAVFRDASAGIDVFDTLIALRDDLTAGDTGAIINSRLGELSAAIDNIATSRAVMGLRLDAIGLTEDILSKTQIDVQSDIESNEQADYAQVVSNINYGQTIYEATLTTTSRLIQGSLFDFIR